MSRIGHWALGLWGVLSVVCMADEEIREVSLTKMVRVDQPREWKYLVLHHTATEAGSVESIDAAHKLRKDADGNPWRGIGYHFLIGNGHGMKDGEVSATFRWKEQADGAHAGNAQYNTQGIGICLVGNFEDAPPTPAQLKSLRNLMTSLRTQCRIEAAGVVRHTDVKKTACPGKHFPWDTLFDAKELSSKQKESADRVVRVGRSE